MCCREGFSPDG
ncbi:hypothetical protein F383_08901 [Gossypium arboreum]|uniref:Uncharacterized protein n=1 Tax=Gossypium arboreum TaxID=29729 RepID=A0A0B0P298_GOSAR|nr:hypothetical protein F383_08901 [Gossypium arboreum]